MNLSIIDELAATNSDNSDVERLAHIYQLLSQTLFYGVAGDVVEVGCNSGGTSVFLRQVLNAMGAHGKRLTVFDSFAGLPEPGSADAYLKQGDCFATRQALIDRFQRYLLEVPTIVEGWIQDTLPTHLAGPVCFAYVDVDFYEGTRFALEQVYPALAPGGILCMDDYCDRERSPRAWEGLPGVRLAVDEFFSDKPEKPVALVGLGDLAMSFIRRNLHG